MDKYLPLFPESASHTAERVDAIYFYLLGIAAFFTTLICVLILYFGIRYRRGSNARRGSVVNPVGLEILWTVIPLVLALGAFAWGAVVFREMKTPPTDALTLEVVGKQWMWKVRHPGGQWEINSLHVPSGQPVRLRMISEDVIHSFYVPAFRLKQDVLPGYYSQLWFDAHRLGNYHLFCAEYCGTEHSLMRGTVTVMEKVDYANWVASANSEPPAVIGRRLFERFRCGSCHAPTGDGVGPPLEGLLGRRVPLQDGRTIIVDDQYLHDSILDPRRHLVAGFSPLMPSFRGQISEGDLFSLIAYIRTLEPGAPRNPATPDNSDDPSSQGNGD